MHALHVNMHIQELALMFVLQLIVGCAVIMVIDRASYMHRVNYYGNHELLFCN